MLAALLPVLGRDLLVAPTFPQMDKTHLEQQDFISTGVSTCAAAAPVRHFPASGSLGLGHIASQRATPIL